jgi:malate synthase
MSVKMTTNSSNQQLTIKINDNFRHFIDNEVMPLTQVNPDQFWKNLQHLIDDLAPRNRELLAKRDLIQQQLDDWHKSNDYQSIDIEVYKAFLKEIGYLVEEGADFSIDTSNVDAEIATMAGPQLVVPLKNARFALNAINARWGSLYDALYGSDIIPKTGKLKPARGGYNELRGREVMKYCRDFLDKHFPLDDGASHHDVTLYQIYYQQFTAVLKKGTYVGLKDSKQFVAFNGSKNSPNEIILKDNGLHINLRINHATSVGSQDDAGVEDLRVEGALTTIMDCEDSVTAVDTEDKIEVYRNWLGLMTGNLSTNFLKGGKTVTRALERDRIFTNRDDEPYYVRRRSLMFIRNVGHLMTIDTIQDSQGHNVPEGILDSVFTSLISTIDLSNNDKNITNSKTGSIYIVKPKMHGPEEVAFTCELFGRIEQLLDIPENTIKVGIMDEERRTTVNLKECIRAAKSRCVFINTGFLDRTGDEMHTSMHAGVFLPKKDIKTQPWLQAYEDWNVDIGLECGLSGKAQIGKGMWAQPDDMKAMMDSKQAHPEAGANTAWVPSPTAAMLHVLHYHEVNVFERQKEIAKRSRANINDILTIPLMPKGKTLTAAEIEQEIENNAQSILGYVVRWVDHGVGCSKVPDIHNVALMEDRATLRISAQLLANWLLHGVTTKEQITTIFKRMSAVVDEQNASDPEYVAMATSTDTSTAFKASLDLVIKGAEQPSGYTEPLLHAYRIQVKAEAKKA